MQNPPPVQTTKSSTGLDENVAALLSYVFGWISGLIFFLIEKDSRLVRFHAMQSILFNVLIGVVAFVLWIIVFILMLILSQVSNALSGLFGILITLVWLLFSVGILIGWVLCLVKAFQGQYFKLPIIGSFAEGERAIDLFGGQAGGNFRVGFHQCVEVAVLVPNSHRIALHPFVRRLARHAFVRQGQEQLTTEDQPARRAEILQHPLRINYQAIDQADCLLQYVIQRDTRIGQHHSLRGRV
jgi:uncharacterized membrane protein